MNHTPLIFYIFLILTVLWFAFMTYLSHQDGEHTRRTSRELAEKFSFLEMDVGLLNSKLRKAAHVVVFAVFTILLGINGAGLAGIHAGELLAWCCGVILMKLQSRWSKAGIFPGLMSV